MKAPTLALLAVAALAAAGCTTTTRSSVKQADPAKVQALKETLSRDSRFSRLRNVSVDPAKGVVKLEGEVSSDADRAYAGRLASAVPGVAFVYNEIEVHESPR